MKSKLLCVLISALLFLGVSSADEIVAPGHYGAEITLDAPVTVGYAIGHIDELKEREILLKGQVAKVCENKGCWMVLQSDQGEVRVTFKDYGFFVSPELIDQQVWAQGRLYEETLDISQARHFAKDAGASQEELQKIDQPVREYRFVATAVAKLP